MSNKKTNTNPKGAKKTPSMPMKEKDMPMSKNGAKKNGGKKKCAEVVNLTDIKPYIRRVLTHVDPSSNTWKSRWNAERVATKYGLTKFQVAAILAHYNMGTYTK